MTLFAVAVGILLMCAFMYYAYATLRVQPIDTVDADAVLRLTRSPQDTEMVPNPQKKGNKFEHLLAGENESHAFVIDSDDSDQYPKGSARDEESKEALL
jgi:hypothetical protein